MENRNGNYYLRFRAWGLGFEVCWREFGLRLKVYYEGLGRRGPSRIWGGIQGLVKHLNDVSA